MMMRFLIAFLIAIGVGKLVSKLKLPAILGWLLAGMILGPHAIGLINQSLLDSVVYGRIINILECSVGLMIGTELVWKKIKSAGKQIIITTLTQSLGTFLFVSLVFGITFYFMKLPIYLAFLFGGIALATAPAPALSIVREFKTDGPVTKTLIPMAALDDMVGVVIYNNGDCQWAGVFSRYAYLYDCIYCFVAINDWSICRCVKRISDEPCENI